MIEKGRISSFQMAILMYPTIIATGILFVPSITAAEAGRDAWLSPLWASSVGFFTVYLAYKLHQYYPQKTIIQYSEDILGKVLGKCLGFMYLFFYLHVNGIIFREYGEFIVGAFLLNTPMSVVLGGMAVVCAMAVRGGVEVIARSAQIFVPIVIFLLMFIVVLLVQDLDPQNILPFLENGIGPSLLGAKAPQGWLSEFILISFLLPFLTDQEKGLRWGMISVAMVVFTMVSTNLVILFLFGEVTENLLYPVMSAARYISIADFFENLQSVVMALWVVGAYVKISVFYYALALGTAQWLNLSNFKPTVYPLGFLLVVFAIWSEYSLITMKDFLAKVGPLYLTSMQTVIPLLLILIVLVQRKIRPQRGQ